MPLNVGLEDFRASTTSQNNSTSHLPFCCENRYMSDIRKEKLRIARPCGAVGSELMENVVFGGQQDELAEQSADDRPWHHTLGNRRR